MQLSSQRNSLPADDSLVLKGGGTAAPIAAIIVSPPNDEALGELTSQDVPSLRFPPTSQAMMNAPLSALPAPRLGLPAFSFHDATSVRHHARGLVTAVFLFDTIIWCAWLCAITVSVGVYPYPRTPNYLFGAAALFEIAADLHPAIQLFLTNTASVSEIGFQLNLCLRVVSTVLIDVSIQRTTTSMVRLCAIAFASHMFGGPEGAPPATRCLLFIVGFFVCFNAAAAPTVPDAVPDIFVMRPMNPRPIALFANTALLVHSLLEVAVVTAVALYARVATQSTERDCAEFRMTVTSVLTAASKMQFATARGLLAADCSGAIAAARRADGGAGVGGQNINSNNINNHRMSATHRGSNMVLVSPVGAAAAATDSGVGGTKNLSETVDSGPLLSPPQRSAVTSLAQKSSQAHSDIDGRVSIRLPRVNVPLAAVRPLLDALLTNLELAAAYRPVDPLDRAQRGGAGGSGGVAGVGGGQTTRTGAGSPSGASVSMNPMGSVSPGAHGHLNANYYGQHHNSGGGNPGFLSARPIIPSAQQNLAVFAMLTIKSQFDAAEAVDEYGAPILHAPVVPPWCWQRVREIIHAHGGCIHEDESTQGVLLVVTWNVRTRHRSPAVAAAECLRRLDDDSILEASGSSVSDDESRGSSLARGDTHEGTTQADDTNPRDLIVAGAALTRMGRPNQQFLIDDMWREVDDVSAYAAMIHHDAVDEDLCDEAVCTAADIYSSATRMMLLQDVESAERLVRPLDPSERRIPLFTFAAATATTGAGAGATEQLLRTVAVRALIDAARGNWRGVQRAEELAARAWAQAAHKTEEAAQVLTGLRWLFAVGRKAIALLQHQHQQQYGQ